MISYFVPDMPSTEQLVPYLKEIEANRWYSNFGPLYKRFIKRLAKECLNDINPERLSLVSSGTSAIELALKSLGLPEGSKILVPAFTFPATAEAIIDAGLTPLICDIDKHSWQLTPAIAKRYIKLHDIAAVVPVAVFGISVDSEKWEAFTQENKIPVVVDAAPALSNQSISDQLVYAFSLHATKPIGAGEGGLVVTPKSSQAEFIRKQSNFGFEPDRSIQHVGTNAKISEYHCAVGLAQLDRIDEINSKRQEVLDAYNSALEKYAPAITTQMGLDNEIPSSLYVTSSFINVEGSFDLLLKQGIETRRLYWPLVQDFPGFKDKILTASIDTPDAKRIAESGLALPFHAFLSEQDIHTVVSALSQISLRTSNVNHKQ